MKNQILNNQILKATKWSSITEIIAKLITPITNMILARILVPDAFGVVATITMIISFADMFTDSGFQKYLVQHEFKSEDHKDISINVAFWTNLVISLILWFVIIVFSEQISIMVGSPGLGFVISVACVQLPLTSFSSIQMAIYRRDFDFKTLFLVRIIGICIPFLVTIPLALLGYGYWSLIIGTILGNLSNALVLTMKSPWKPSLKYDINVLKEMLSFSIWSLIEAISIWAVSWIDTFLIGSALDSYYVGLYKTSTSSVNGIFALITGATTPILFSALSRVQDDEKEFNKIFFNMQKIVSYLVLPLSIGMFIYRDIVVSILLGSNWSEAKDVVAISSLMTGIVIILGHYSSEIYRAKGKPKLSFLAQMLHLMALVPICMVYAKKDFMTFVYMRSVIRLELVLVHLIFIKFIIKMPIENTFKNIMIPAISSIVMGIIGFNIRSVYSHIIWQIITIFICIIVYLLILLIFKESRDEIKNLINKSGIRDKIRCKQQIAKTM